jgi:hypothetical protein
MRGLESAKRQAFLHAATRVPNLVPTPHRLSRRTLLKAGLAGGAALLLARWLYDASSPQPLAAAATGTGLDRDARQVLSAIIPVLLAGAMPAGSDARQARDEALSGAEQAIAGLPPAARKELDQLFALLAFAPTRCLVAGVWSPWAEAPPDSIAAFLSSWRDSRFALLRSAYDALHQIICGAWYGNPRSWPAIGYPGPPSLSSD